MNLPGTHADFPVPCTPRTAEAKHDAAVQALQARRFVLRHAPGDAGEILDILGLVNTDRKLQSSEQVRMKERNDRRSHKNARGTTERNSHASNSGTIRGS